MHESQPERKTSPRQSAIAAAPLAAVVVANIALAFGPLFVRLSDVGPVAAAFWRMSLATPVIIALAMLGGGKPFAGTRRFTWLFVFGGLAFAADLGSWHIGIMRTTLANSTLFGNSATLIYPIYGFIVARAWPSRSQGFALALAAAGAALLMGRSAELSARHLAGDLFCLLAGVLYAFYFILLARARTTVAPMPALALSSLTTVAPLLALSWAMGETILPHAWGPLVALAFLSQIVGQGLMIYALGKLSPLVVGIALLIQPVVAATIGWFVFDERLEAPDLVGALLVAVALVLVRRGGVSAARLARTKAPIRSLG